MTVNRRSLCAAGLALFLAFGAAGAVQAQEWPSKPLRWIVPQPPAGTADFVARLLGEKLAERLGQRVVIDNKPGAGGNLGTELGAKAAADGYTLVLGTIGPIAVNQSLYQHLPFDAQRDFVPVSLLASYPCVILTNPEFAPRSIGELIALTKAQPQPLNYASPGVGTSPHLAGELFATASGARLSHVAYKGSAAGLNDAMAGHVPIMVDALQPTSLALVRSGKLRALAVTSEARTPNLPDVPTVAESGLKEFEVTGWMGVLVPAGTPPAVVARLAEEFSAILKLPEIKASLAEKGALDVPPTGPEFFGRFIRTESEKWRKVVVSANIKAQ
jgi:tripartite-type tricarboxylate transporter receptor subunit TctC